MKPRTAILIIMGLVILYSFIGPFNDAQSGHFDTPKKTQ